jgi:hypothetical protein
MCFNETYSEIRKHLPDAFPIQNVYLKQRDASPPLLFNVALEYAIGIVQEIREGLQFNGTHQIIVHSVYVIVRPGGNICVL